MEEPELYFFFLILSVGWILNKIYSRDLLIIVKFRCGPGYVEGEYVWLVTRLFRSSCFSLFSRLLAHTQNELRQCVFERDCALKALEQSALSFRERVRAAEEEG